MRGRARGPLPRCAADRICCSTTRRSRGLTDQDAAHTAPGKSWPLVPLIAWLPAGLLPGDLIAGLTLAAIAIPEQMATARLGGFSPQIGFFAFVAGSLGFAAAGEQPLPVLRRGFDHHADLRRRAGAAWRPAGSPTTSRSRSRSRFWSACS